MEEGASDVITGSPVMGGNVNSNTSRSMNFKMREGGGVGTTRTKFSIGSGVFISGSTGSLVNLPT